MIKLTYLIPVYNEFKTVAKSINQILNLKLKDKEIIIIDNSSRDRSQNEIKKFKNEKNFTDVIGSKFYKKNIFKKIIIKEKTKTWSSWDFELKNRLISGFYKIMEVFTDYKPRQNFQDKKPRPYHLLFMMWLIIKCRYILYISRNAYYSNQ